MEWKSLFKESVREQQEVATHSKERYEPCDGASSTLETVKGRSLGKLTGNVPPLPCIVIDQCNGPFRVDALHLCAPSTSRRLQWSVSPPIFSRSTTSRLSSLVYRGQLRVVGVIPLVLIKGQVQWKSTRRTKEQR